VVRGVVKQEGRQQQGKGEEGRQIRNTKKCRGQLTGENRPTTGHV
jgi:hypothetical protein